MRNRGKASSIRRKPGALAVTALLVCPVGHAAMQYGIFEARGLAMGGATVASSTNDNAVFYNSALLAFYDEFEENTQDSRFLFPLIVPQLSDSLVDLEQLASDAPDDAFNRVVANFNADPSAANAQSVVALSGDLEQRFAELANQSLLADLYFGFAIIQPSRRQGAGFFMGARVVGGGLSDISDADLALLQAYQEGLSFVATGGAQGVQHAELFDANGALIDPNAQLDSSVAARGAAILEVGVAASHEFFFGEQPVALGMNFKVMQIDTFEETQRVISGRITTSQNDNSYIRVNADLGAAVELGAHFRVGLAVKDVIPRNLDTRSGNRIKLRPRVRLGAAYQSGRLLVAADIDLVRNEPLGAEPPSQEIALGAEFALAKFLRLRGGYRHDLKNNRDAIVSIGLGTSWRRLLFDVAYADAGDARAAALQFGYAFY